VIDFGNCLVADSGNCLEDSLPNYLEDCDWLVVDFPLKLNI
jgi:hypothetical protein